VSHEQYAKKSPKPPEDYTEEEYKSILSGRTRLDAARQQRIAIIGAGMAGLVAGSLLKRAGQLVTLFEAKHVVGGRVKTLRERFTSNFYAEAGAMRIPLHHNLTNWLAYDVFDLGDPLHFVDENPNGLMYINNQRCTFAAYGRNPHSFGFELSDHEKGKTAQFIFDHCLQEHIRSYKKEVPQLSAFDLKSLRAAHLH
jgi:monoamine oxidase